MSSFLAVRVSTERSQQTCGCTVPPKAKADPRQEDRWRRDRRSSRGSRTSRLLLPHHSLHDSTRSPSGVLPRRIRLRGTARRQARESRGLRRRFSGGRESRASSRARRAGDAHDPVADDRDGRRSCGRGYLNGRLAPIRTPIGSEPEKATMQLLHQTCRSRIDRLNAAGVTGGSSG